MSISVKWIPSCQSCERRNMVVTIWSLWLRKIERSPQRWRFTRVFNVLCDYILGVPASSSLSSASVVTVFPIIIIKIGLSRCQQPLVRNENESRWRYREIEEDIGKAAVCSSSAWATHIFTMFYGRFNFMAGIGIMSFCQLKHAMRTFHYLQHLLAAQPAVIVGVACRSHQQHYVVSLRGRERPNGFPNTAANKAMPSHKTRS